VLVGLLPGCERFFFNILGGVDLDVAIAEAQTRFCLFAHLKYPGN
jgi:hypothetical protein